MEDNSNTGTQIKPTKTKHKPCQNYRSNKNLNQKPPLSRHHYHRHPNKKMSNTDKPTKTQEEEQQEEVEDLTFEQLGLDPRLIRALTKKNIEKPTPIQQTGIPLILVSFCLYVCF